MIALESLFLWLIRLGGGLLAGWGLLEIVNHCDRPFSPMGVSLGYWCVALLGYLRAGRIAGCLHYSRMAALASVPGGHAVPPVRGRRTSLGRHLDGLLLISVNPLVVFYIRAGHRALRRLGDLGLPGDGYRIRALGAATTR